MKTFGSAFIAGLVLVANVSALILTEPTEIVTEAAQVNAQAVNPDIVEAMQGAFAQTQTVAVKKTMTNASGIKMTLDPTALIRQGHAYTIDSTAKVNNNVVYTKDPNAYKDPKTQNVYTLVTKAVQKDGHIFTPDAEAFTSGGKIYTLDSKAIINQGAVYSNPTKTAVAAPLKAQTLAPIAATPVVPVLTKSAKKALVKKASHANIVVLGQMVTTKEGKKLIVFDPKKQ